MQRRTHIVQKMGINFYPFFAHNVAAVKGEQEKKVEKERKGGNCAFPERLPCRYVVSIEIYLALSRFFFNCVSFIVDQFIRIVESSLSFNWIEFIYRQLVCI